MLSVFNWQLPKCRCGMGQAQVVLDNAKMDAKNPGKDTKVTQILTEIMEMLKAPVESKNILT